MSSKRRSHKKQNTNEFSAVAPRAKGVSQPPLTLSKRRTWFFRIAAAILAPLLFFALLEGGLRLGGYGYPTGFFLGPDSEGNYSSNPRFGWRFFPRALARRPIPSSISNKPHGTVRIFVLGSSAAQGIPEPAFGFGRILEVMLQERYPASKFEVVNAAMTAINSHVARQIAFDCAALEPDLFVVYMGNNEVVGPYGPGTIFQAWSPSLKFIHANIFLKATRTGQLLDNAMGFFRAKGGDPESWRGMEMFLGNQIAADDSRLPVVHDNFRQNILDICAAAKRAGAGVILSTVAVNLKDCPPFASRHRADLSEAELTQWKSLYETGAELEAKEQWGKALEKYAAAAKIDDKFAELAFRQGRCLFAENRFPEARERFVAARDSDVLRFRADTGINAAIRAAAAAEAPSGVRLLDAERELSDGEGILGGILGKDLFYEHVHFTFEGNYRLARSALAQVEASLPKLAAQKKGPVLTKEQCADSLALTPWDEYQMAVNIAEMTSKPPFTDQLDHQSDEISKNENLRVMLETASTPEALQKACKLYEKALSKAPDNWELRHRFGKLATAAGQAQTSVDELRIVSGKLPEDAVVHNDLGNALKNCGRIDEAIAEYRKCVEIDPRYDVAYYNLGVILSDQGRTNEAISEYEKALKINPRFAMVHNNLGNALSQSGKNEEAIAQFKKALELDPHLTIAHCNLGNTLYHYGRKEEAVKEIQRALEIDPKFAIAHYNLGKLYDRERQINEAVAEYQKAVEIDPAFAPAHTDLAQALSRRGQYSQAVAHFRKALEIEPRSAIAEYNLGRALIADKQVDEAILHLHKSLNFDPKLAIAYNALGKVLAYRGQTLEALDNFRKALEIDPNFAEARRNLAIIRSGGLEPAGP